MLDIGSVVEGKYKILNEIGRGGMSIVYLAINEKANKPWAIKEVRKTGIENYQIIWQSLIMEMDLLKKLKHPRLPSIVDIIEQEDNILIVMDYIEGITLNDIVVQQGPQQEKNVVDWALQICEVLEYLHTRTPSIIYRDMKPSNVMLKSDGNIVLIDFGTAREYKEKNIEDTTCLGTMGYAAPEQFGGHGQTDERTDIYCLGTTMYHLLTGHNPTEPPYELYPITFWNDALSSGLEKIVIKCTQKNPDDRFQTIDELRDALINYKELEIPVVKKYKKNIILFLMLCILIIVCSTGSLTCYISAQYQQKTQYDYLVELAETTTIPEEKMQYYMQAINTDYDREDAYNGIIDYFLEDACFQAEEEKIILQINASVNKYLQNMNKTNKNGYANICFRIGNAYWFYYEHEESRQVASVPWYSKAANIYKEIPNKEIEYKRCTIYSEIGNFYNRILAAQVEGTDMGMYGEYWDNLVELKKYNDMMPDRELITLRLYHEIVMKTMEYAKKLKEDGVGLDEILFVYDEITIHMQQLQKESNELIIQEVERINILMDKSKQILQSTYL